MTRRRGPATKPCSVADARTRLAAASDFLRACTVLEDSSISNDVVASNAILAAIAASDAICGAKRQERSASGNHGDAADLLKLIDKPLGDDLAKILGYKNNASYGTRAISDPEMKTCVRVATKLFERAQQALQGAIG